MHDIRGMQARLPKVYDTDTGRYGAAQSLARGLRESDSDGLVYDSVRDPGGECIAVFKPRLLAPVKQGPHYCHVWDGREITGSYMKQEYRPS